MEIFTWAFNAIDSFLIAPYRLPDNPLLGWWVGTTILALWSVLLGEITLAIAFRANRFRIEELGQEMSDRHNQSINALKSGDKSSYKAINSLANDAFGKTFFLQIAMACASLWPAACALGWLQIRFSKIMFPIPYNLPRVGNDVGYTFIFILLYILSRILFKNLKSTLAHKKT
jgi:hypothetical protein